MGKRLKGGVDHASRTALPGPERDKVHPREAVGQNKVSLAVGHFFK
jgi:hypothetical protein